MVSNFGSMEEYFIKYCKKYDEIKVQEEFQFGLAQSFVSELLSLVPEKRYTLLPLLKKIEEEAFEKGIVISNLKYSNLVREKEKWEESLNNSSKKVKIKVEIEDDFNKALFHFFSKHEQLFKRIKGYFVFKFENNIDFNTKIIVLFDEDFNKHPEINSFDVRDEKFDIKKFQIKDFLDLANKESEIKYQNYLCVLLITSNLRNNVLVSPHIESLISLFDKSNFISLKNIPITDIKDYEIKNVSEGIKSINCYSSKIFNNRALSFEQEFIIKKLFEGNEMILDYKILKEGNSGSKVIEIQPLKGDHPSMGRFVVKFAFIDHGKKLEKELAFFREFIEELPIMDKYVARYEETSSYEAIRYNYASSDSTKDSFPFSDLITKYITKGKDECPYSLSAVINELFDCGPYKVWNSKPYEVNEQIKQLYYDYLKSEEKIFKSIILIKGIEEKSLDGEELIMNYKKIKDYSLKTKKKICHGDLHSENFFKDEKGVYLIDFGWTGRLHSLIDHATLECSLKFKHLPFYIPIDDLISYEKALLNLESFSSSFNLSFIKRNLAKDIFSLIVQIREKSKMFMFDNESPLEYLIALFIISFRQIQYADLNQNYAMQSADILSKEIIKLIV